MMNTHKDLFLWSLDSDSTRLANALIEKSASIGVVRQAVTPGRIGKLMRGLKDTFRKKSPVAVPKTGRQPMVSSITGR